MSCRYVVGVTGGIGSGKSTVCDEFVRLGVPLVDADEAARAVVARGSAGLAEVAREFGDAVLTPSGDLDRSTMRRLVFEDPARRARLEAILHPRIREYILEQLATLEGDYCLLCIPLLTERGAYPMIDRILVVDCDVETQIARVMARDGGLREQAIAIVNSQATRAERLRLADDVVDNDGALDDLTARVAALHRRYLGLASAAPEA